jgi:excisionase family DNA binding protein
MHWNLREAADALHMAERELLRLAREGGLPAARVGDRYLFNPWSCRIGRSAPTTRSIPI